MELWSFGVFVMRQGASSLPPILRRPKPSRGSNKPVEIAMYHGDGESDTFRPKKISNSLIREKTSILDNSSSEIVANPEISHYFCKINNIKL